MCACLKKPLEEGAFTIHRNENLFWSGTWTDMTIEQSLMRSGKTHGQYYTQGVGKDKMVAHSSHCCTVQ